MGACKWLWPRLRWAPPRLDPQARRVACPRLGARIGRGRGTHRTCRWRVVRLSQWRRHANDVIQGGPARRGIVAWSKPRARNLPRHAAERPTGRPACSPPPTAGRRDTAVPCTTHHRAGLARVRLRIPTVQRLEPLGSRQCSRHPGENPAANPLHRVSQHRECFAGARGAAPRAALAADNSPKCARATARSALRCVSSPASKGRSPALGLAGCGSTCRLDDPRDDCVGIPRIPHHFKSRAERLAQRSPDWRKALQGAHAFAQLVAQVSEAETWVSAGCDVQRGRYRADLLAPPRLARRSRRGGRLQVRFIFATAGMQLRLSQGCQEAGRSDPLWQVGLQAPSERGGAATGGRSAGTPRPIFHPPLSRARRAVAGLPAGARDIARACGGARPPMRSHHAHRHPGLGDPLASGVRIASRHNRVPHRPAWPRTPPSPSGGDPQEQRQAPWSGSATAVALLGPPPRPPRARLAPTRAQAQSRDAGDEVVTTHRPVLGSRERRPAAMQGGQW